MLSGLAPSTTFVEFQTLIQEKTGIEPHMQIFKTGFPPLPLAMPSDPSTAEIGMVIPQGDMLLVEEQRSEDTSMHPVETSALHSDDVAFQSGSFPVLPSSMDSSSDYMVHCLMDCFKSKSFA